MNFGEQICCALSDKMSFDFFCPIWSHVNENETKIRKNPKFEISPIFIQLWYRPFLEVCMIFFQRICYVLSEEMSFEGFFPMWSHVNENEKKNREKSKMQNFEKKKWSGDMVNKYLSTKFGINLLDRFRENGFYGRTDGRMDARVTTVALLCSSTKQS